MVTRARHRLDQDVLPFAVKIGRHQADSGDIAARVGKRGRKPSRDHVLGIASGDDRIGCGFDYYRHEVVDLLVTGLEASGNNCEIPPFDEAVDA